MWKQHGEALLRLPRRMGKTITQLNHEWLPVQASHSINASGTGRLCPFCTTCEETQHHFMSCNHSKLSELWNNAASTIKTKITAYDKSIHHHLIQLIGLAITSWRTNPAPSVPHFLAPQFHQLLLSQAQIGWDHILKGRFSKQWRHHMQPDRDKALQWVTFTIKTIWHQVYNVWKSRCQTKHGITNDDKTERALLYLTPKVQDLYNQGTTLQTDVQYMFQSSVDETLLKPIPIIKAWVHKVSLRIRNIQAQAKAKRRQEKAKISQVHPLFTRQASKP
jgi:hypothetical protein